MGGHLDGVVHGLQKSPASEVDTISTFESGVGSSWNQLREMYDLTTENARILQDTLDVDYPDMRNSGEKEQAMLHFVVSLEALTNAWQEARVLEQHEHALRQLKGEAEAKAA